MGRSRRCARAGCSKSTVSKHCMTACCPGCCALIALEERLAGRDGSLLCPFHKDKIAAKLSESEDAITEADAARNNTAATTSTPGVSPRRFVNPDSSNASTSNAPSSYNTLIVDSDPPKPPSPQSSTSTIVRPLTTNTGSSRSFGRAMPANIKFPEPKPAEESRYDRASQRARQEDIAAMNQVKIVICSQVVRLICDIIITALTLFTEEDVYVCTS
jgi:hypothetical protein